MLLRVKIVGKYPTMLYVLKRIQDECFRDATSCRKDAKVTFGDHLANPKHLPCLAYRKRISTLTSIARNNWKRKRRSLEMMAALTDAVNIYDAA